jgi:hypothetical protein
MSLQSTFYQFYFCFRILIHSYMYFLLLIYSFYLFYFILVFRHSIPFSMLHPSFSFLPFTGFYLSAHVLRPHHLARDVTIVRNHCPALSCLGTIISEDVSVHQPVGNGQLLVDLESCFMVCRKTFVIYLVQTFLVRMWSFGLSWRTPEISELFLPFSYNYYHELGLWLNICQGFFNFSPSPPCSEHVFLASEHRRHFIQSKGGLNMEVISLPECRGWECKKRYNCVLRMPPRRGA